MKLKFYNNHENGIETSIHIHINSLHYILVHSSTISFSIYYQYYSMTVWQSSYLLNKRNNEQVKLK